MERAQADLHRGDARMARHRLRSYLVNRPDDMTARSVLAQLYRQDGYPDEAGRWGYLVAEAASDFERALYERACAHRLTRDWTATYLLKGLHWTCPVEKADAYAAAILRDLDVRAGAEEAAYLRQIDRFMISRSTAFLLRLRDAVGRRRA